MFRKSATRFHVVTNYIKSFILACNEAAFNTVIFSLIVSIPVNVSFNPEISPKSLIGKWRQMTFVPGKM